MLKGDIGSPEEATKEDEGLRGAKGEGMTKASRSECYDKQMSRCHSRFVDNMIINNVCNVTDYACFYSSPLVIFIRARSWLIMPVFIRARSWLIMPVCKLAMRRVTEYERIYLHITDQ